MNTIGPVLKETTTLVTLGTRVLSKPALRDLISAGAELGNIAAEINSALDLLVACFSGIARGLYALVEPLRQARLVLALAEVAGPVLGGLTEAVAAFGEQLGRLIPDVKPPKDMTKALGGVKKAMDAAAAWGAEEIPKPEVVAALAKAVGEGLIAALNGLRPNGRPAQLVIAIS